MVSPRQTPIGSCLTRVVRDRRSDFTFIVGSDAVHSDYWPTVNDDLEEDEVSRQIAGTVMDKSGMALANRGKTHTHRLRVEEQLDGNPVLKAFLKARQMVDLQKREDVRGDSDALAVAFERVWGAQEGTISGENYLTVDVVDNLARYAIGADQAFP